MESNFGQRLSDLKEARGWSQNELALRSGVHPTTIGLYLKNARVPGIDTVRQIAQAFGITVSQLLGEEPVQDPEVAAYRSAIEAAKQHGLSPEDLVRLINTTAGLFAKK